MTQQHASRSLEARLQKRAAANARHGTPEGWASDALDCYLDGMSFGNIAHIMGVCTSAARGAVLGEALYRVMAAHKAAHVEELKAQLPAALN